VARTPIALLTDYGLSGPYVGALKAVILSINPEAAVFDLTHEIGPQQVEEGAFVLAQALPYLPRGAVCVAVVDPGVGTARRAIALRTERATFVGPDNGLFSGALDTRPGAETKPGSTTLVPLGPACEAVELVNPEFFLQPVSNTFHGRDIFAPVAAHLTLGRRLSDLGPALETVQAFPSWRSPQRPDGALAGRVIFIDGFGNLITDVVADDLPQGPGRLSVQIAGREFTGLQHSFQDGPEYVVYVGSSGYLEVAKRNGNASEALHAERGAPVLVWSTER
jgi:S-adenosylmethionine hydrolase